MAPDLHRAFRLCGLAVLMSLAACQEPGATYNQPSKDDLFASTLILTPSDERAILAAMREALPGPEEAVAPARYGVRWSDVPDAVRWGGNVAEFATYASERVSDDCWVYQLISVADEPATLTIRRVPPPKVYEAHAVAGIFGDRQDLVDRLLHEIHLAMLMFGAKAQPVSFDEAPPPDERAPAPAHARPQGRSRRPSIVRNSGTQTVGAVRKHSARAASKTRAIRRSDPSANAGPCNCTPIGRERPSRSANPPGIERPQIPAMFALTV